jgi:hypothetical protein
LSFGQKIFQGQCQGTETGKVSKLQRIGSDRITDRIMKFSWKSAGKSEIARICNSFTIPKVQIPAMGLASNESLPENLHNINDQISNNFSILNETLY